MPGPVDKIMTSLGFDNRYNANQPGVVGGSNTSFAVFVQSLGLDPNNIPPEMREQLMQMFMQMKMQQQGEGQARRDALRPTPGYTNVGARARG